MAFKFPCNVDVFWLSRRQKQNYVVIWMVLMHANISLVEQR